MVGFYLVHFLFVLLLLWKVFRTGNVAVVWKQKLCLQGTSEGNTPLNNLIINESFMLCYVVGNKFLEN